MSSRASAAPNGETVVAAMRAEDAGAFAELVEPLRRELYVYRIATNACLNFLGRRPERAHLPLPDDSDQEEVPWLQPASDRLPATTPDQQEPGAVAVTRETIELAFLVAVQHLPPRQRAVLILRDMLGWPAKDAALLEISVASVNSALQRSRAMMRTHLPRRPYGLAALEPFDLHRTSTRSHHDAKAQRRHRYTTREGVNAPASITITPVLVADLHIEGERMPVYVHVIDHPDARVLVDTGMTELHPWLADMDPRLRPLSEQDFDIASIDIVVNTHLHGDHCGGNHLFAGKPIYVQRRELDDARTEDDYTIREWLEAPGVRYMPVDGELELLPGIRLVPAPGHTPGTQIVVVETGGRPVIIGGDMAVWFGELDEPETEGQLLVRALDPELVWLAHVHEPWRPSPPEPGSTDEW